jgi:hypothetical protein
MTALTVLGAALFLCGILFLGVGVAGLAGHRFAPGSVSPAMAPGWRVVVGIAAVAGSVGLRKVVESAKNQLTPGT